MKKRLLISSVLMSAVLACALGTGTYAWYQAGGGATVKAGTAVSGSISLDKPTLDSTDYIIDLDVTINQIELTSTKTLVLSHYDNSWKTGHRNAADVYVPRDAAGTETYYQVYEVKVTANSDEESNGSELQDLIAASTESWKITFSSPDATGTYNEKASLWTSEDEITTLTAAPGVKDYVEFNVSDLTAEQAVVVGYLVVYIDGAHGPAADGTGNHTADSYSAHITSVSAKV